MKKQALIFITALSLGILAQTAVADKFQELNDSRPIAKGPTMTQASLAWFISADGKKYQGYQLTASVGGASFQFAAVVGDNLILMQGTSDQWGGDVADATTVGNAAVLPSSAEVRHEKNEFLILFKSKTYSVPANAPNYTLITVVTT